MAEDNVYLCIVCGKWFPTKDAKKTHECSRYMSREGDQAWNKEFKPVSPDKERHTFLGKRLKELGEIKNRREVNFFSVEELEKMVIEAEEKK